MCSRPDADPVAQREPAREGSGGKQDRRGGNRQPDLLGESNVGLQVGLIENAAYNDRRPFIARLIELSPTIRVKRPPSAALEFALERSKIAALIAMPGRPWADSVFMPLVSSYGQRNRGTRYARYVLPTFLLLPCARP